MKSGKIHLPNLAYIAAFIIGVILFVAIWNTLFGAASIGALLAGMAGVVVAVTVFWILNEGGKQDNNED